MLQFSRQRVKAPNRLGFKQAMESSFNSFNRGSIFSKYCGEKCIRRISRTLDNPGRVFWACPMDSGGHGWMEWDDLDSSTKTKERRSLKEKLILVAFIVVSELIKDCLVVENKNLKQMLDKNNL
ncbi:hypothetical protein Leryth_017267 [Lithospermum erythrorhizon]|nr:hypothetical protein Leryth_017267 [Lithospermum erythrorhizon]